MFPRSTLTCTSLICFLALAPWEAALRAEIRTPEVRKADLPIGGVRTKGRWTYYGGLIHFNRVRVSRDGSVLWAATDKGVLRLDIERERLTRFSTLDGLADNCTADIALGVDNSVWAATYSGLSLVGPSGCTTWDKKDGLVSSNLSRVAIDRSQRPWVSSGGTLPNAISYFHSTRWVHYSQRDDGLGGAGVDLLHAGAKGKVWAIVYDADHSLGRADIFVRRSASLAVFSPDGTWQMMPLPKHLLAYRKRRAVTGLESFEDGRLVAATVLGLFAWDGKSWTRYGTREGLPDEVVIDICPGPADTIWGLTRRGIFSFNGTGARLEVRIPQEVQEKAGPPTQVAVGPEGDIWIVPDPPVQLVHGEGLRWTIYMPEIDGPMTQSKLGVNTILHDKASYHYFAAAGQTGGLSRFDGQKWEILYVGDVRSAALDKKGQPWIATGAIQRYVGKEWVDQTESLGLAGPVNTVHTDRQGTLWIAGEKDLLEWDGSKIVNHAGDTPQFLPPYAAMASGQAGHFWVRCGQGVAQWKGEKLWKLAGKSDGLPGITGKAAAVGPRGEVYLGGPWGAAQYDGRSWTHFVAEDVVYQHALPSLPGRQVNTILVDRQGTVWFGTDDGGIATYDGRNWGKMTTADGLPSNGVWSVIEDENSFWFGTLAGVSRFRKR